MGNKGRYKETDPLLACDLPIGQPGLLVHHELLLKGWAVSVHGIADVIVRIDDERQLRASYGLDTPWLPETFPGMPGAERAGYELRLDTSEWTPGTHRIAIVAGDRKGRRGEVSGQVEVLPFAQPHYTVEDNLAAIAAGEPAMWLEAPRIVDRVPEVDGALEMSGWAYAAGGIDSVVVSIDGRARYEALRPISRGDLLAPYGPQVAGEGGFVLRLDSMELVPGVHTISVVALAHDGQAVGVEGKIAVPEPTAAEENGDPRGVDWLAERRRPRLRHEGGPQVHAPDRHADRVLESERELRYRWAAGLAAGKDVLDLGEGTSPGPELLLEAGANRVELVRDDRHNLGFDDDSFDLIVCFDLVQRVADPDALIEEMRRVLRPDGCLLISIPRRRVELGDDRRRRELTPGELERSLRDRFRNVALHHQQTWLSSTLLEQEEAADGSGGADLDLGVRRIGSARPGEEAHMVAIAADGPLPTARGMAVLASAQPVRDALASALMWEDRARLAEADAAASRTEANLAQMHQKGAVGKLREIEARLQSVETLEASLSWRITRPLRSLKRILRSGSSPE